MIKTPHVDDSIKLRTPSSACERMVRNLTPSLLQAWEPISSKPSSRKVKQSFRIAVTARSAFPSRPRSAKCRRSNSGLLLSPHESRRSIATGNVRSESAVSLSFLKTSRMHLLFPLPYSPVRTTLFCSRSQLAIWPASTSVSSFVLMYLTGTYSLSSFTPDKGSTALPNGDVSLATL